MKERVRKLIAGTPVEPAARWAWAQLRRLGGKREPMLEEDRWTVAILQRVLRDDSTCVDVGCANGAILRQMLRFAPKGKHFAFEPRPQAAQALREHFPQVQVFELALADTQGESTFQHVVSNPGYSGLRARQYPSANETIETLHVRTDRLDNVLPAGQSIALLKIDVEGAEFQVLQGAEDTIRRSRPYIVFEHGKGAAEFYGTTSEQIYDFLVGTCGLRVSLPPDWLAGRPPLDRGGFVSQFGGPIWYFLAHPPRP